MSDELDGVPYVVVDNYGGPEHLQNLALLVCALLRGLSYEDKIDVLQEALNCVMEDVDE
jgi:hypothetical protein